MSGDIHLRCFQRGQPAGIPRQSLRSLFPIVQAESKRDSWVVRYDESNACSIGITACITDSSLIESLSVSRPCKDLRLWNGVLEAMRLGPVVLYCPGGTPPLVASAAVTMHLPPDMIKALGPPLVVQSAQDILTAIAPA
jgi:hypothetical protein